MKISAKFKGLDMYLAFNERRKLTFSMNKEAISNENYYGNLTTYVIIEKGKTNLPQSQNFYHLGRVKKQSDWQHWAWGTEIGVGEAIERGSHVDNVIRNLYKWNVADIRWNS